MVKNEGKGKAKTKVHEQDKYREKEKEKEKEKENQTFMKLFLTNLTRLVIFDAFLVSGWTFFLTILRFY